MALSGTRLKDEHFKKEEFRFMDYQLKGRRALVTGSSSGLGEAIAKMLAAEGVEVFIHGRDEKRATRVADEIRASGGLANIVLGDLSTDSGAEKVAKECLKPGNVDILVNNAGAYAHTGWMDTTPEEWKATYNLNVVSYIRMIQHLLPSMKKSGWGRIINMGGGLAVQPLAIQPHYSATLAARHNLSASLARELAGTGVTSNVIAPGAILNEQVKQWLVSQSPKHNWGVEFDEIEQNAVKQLVPNDRQRFGRPEEIAAAVLYLVGPYSDYVSGATVRVDGGTVKSV
ncbi:SDR family NAD(P)-dependent oxidoreductase [Chryseolinea sp. T2]|uniref:SDR family NAD(P)-dependent oxidoreductase n=1 Tax=Chryseolinea sp. T2 TaxID=3129255 RepID=UPI003078A3F0